jgi:hypothetical protein
MTETQYRGKHLLGCLAMLVSILLISGHPIYGFLSDSKSPGSKSTTLIQSRLISDPISTSTDNEKNSTIKTMGSKAVITCVNSTIKNALIDVVINRPLVNVNGSIILDPTFLNQTMTNIMGCVNKIENKMALK